jgi:hypothetical protein
LSILSLHLAPINSLSEASVCSGTEENRGTYLHKDIKDNSSIIRIREFAHLISIRRRYLLVAVALLLISVSVIGIWWWGSRIRLASSDSVIQVDRGTNSPLVMNTLQYAQVTDELPLVVPSEAYIASAFGGSYRIQGVLTGGKPQPQTFPSYDGKTNHTILEWNAGIIIWDKNVVNGTTTDTYLFRNGGIVLGEAPAPPGVNSTRSALDLLAPPVLCHTFTDTANASTQTSCQTVTTAAGDGYITKINGFAVIVYPSGDAITWLDDRNLMWYDISSGSVGIAQLLQFAKLMIG